MRRLIVTADDFGRTRAINRGVIRAHERGIVTAASLMVRWPDAADAVRLAESGALDIGLHVDLGEWSYDGAGWVARYEVVDPGNLWAVADEVRRQVDAFRELVGRDPTHIDSHQHVHRAGAPRRAVLDVGRMLGVPVRQCTKHITYCGAFFGHDHGGRPHHAAITLEALLALVRALPSGTTELGCHPADAADGHSTYDIERTIELAVLCDPAVRNELVAWNVALCSFTS